MRKFNWSVILAVFFLSGCSGEEKLSDYLIPKQNTMSPVSLPKGFLLETYVIKQGGALLRSYDFNLANHTISETSTLLSVRDGSILLKEGSVETKYPDRVASKLELYSEKGIKVYISNADRRVRINGEETKCVDIDTELFGLVQTEIYCKGVGRVGFFMVGTYDKNGNLIKKGDLHTAGITLKHRPEQDFEEAILDAIRLDTVGFINRILPKEQKLKLNRLLFGVQEIIFKEAHSLYRGGFHTLEAQKLEKYGMKEPLGKISAASLASCLISHDLSVIVSYLEAKALISTHFDAAKGRALSEKIGECLENIPGIPKKLAATGATSSPVMARSKGENPGTTIEGKDYTYRLVKLDPKKAAEVFMLMTSKPTSKKSIPPDESPIYQDTKIIEEAKGERLDSQKTSLMAGGTKILTTSLGDEIYQYQIEHFSLIEAHPELLLLDVWMGGNSCSAKQQVLIVLGADGFHVSKPFGRCFVDWWDDTKRNTLYFIYSADENNPLEIIALTYTPR